MKKCYRVISLIAVFIFVFSLYGSFGYAENNKNDDNNLMSALSIDDIKYQVNKNLTEKQVHERFRQINSKYKVNEPFSSEDTEFIRAYATLSGTNGLQHGVQPAELTVESFDETKSRYGVNVRFKGKLFSDIGLVQHSYGGNVGTYTTAGDIKVDKIETTIENTAYGLIGTSGTYVGIVYDDSVSNSTTRDTLLMDRTVKYGAVAVLFTYTNAFSTITTNVGSFDIYAF